MNIRHALLEDLDILDKVEQECFPPEEAASRRSLEGRLRVYPHHFWLLEDEGRLVSFVNGPVTEAEDLLDEMFSHPELHTETGRWQMILGVNTTGAYRRRGCAGMVLERVIGDARAQGRRGLVLTCKEHLVPYYAKFGFVSEGLSGSTHGGARWYQMRLTFDSRLPDSSGGVLFTHTPQGRQYVLVMETAGHCGLPKGHLEPGETEQQAALREIREECGVTAELLPGFRREVAYPIGVHVKRVSFFLARYEGQGLRCTGEVAEILLLPYEQALERLTYEQSREVLKAAEAFLQRR